MMKCIKVGSSQFDWISESEVVKELSGKLVMMCLRIVLDLALIVLWKSLSLERWIRSDGDQKSSSKRFHEGRLGLRGGSVSCIQSFRHEPVK